MTAAELFKSTQQLDALLSEAMLNPSASQLLDATVCMRVPQHQWVRERRSHRLDETASNKAVRELLASAQLTRQQVREAMCKYKAVMRLFTHVCKQNPDAMEAGTPLADWFRDTRFLLRTIYAIARIVNRQCAGDAVREDDTWVYEAYIMLERFEKEDMQSEARAKCLAKEREAKKAELALSNKSSSADVSPTNDAVTITNK